MSIQQNKYAAVVVGGGPAGITVLGNLLERDVGPVLWIDEKFQAGRVNRAYREVPSNTKVKLFVDFAEATAPFRKVLESTPSPNAIDALRKLPQDQGCGLSYAADMCLMLTEGLKQTPGVDAQQGRVVSTTQNASGEWLVDYKSADAKETSKAVASRLILCTGSSPTSQTLPVTIPGIEHIELDYALSPSLIAKELPKQPLTVAVIGASHSAVLVLINLYNLASSTHPDLRIKWFTRHELRYAEYMDGWILRDNTGLKGAAAAWARDNLEPDSFAKSPVSKYISKISYQKEAEAETYREQLQDCDYYVQAIGYTRDPIPALRRAAGEDVKDIAPTYDHLSGGFTDGNGAKIPGLYAAGIAWPERVTDPYGNVEYAVGFFKFMKFVKRVSGDWN